jgi:hypothetical protein
MFEANLHVLAAFERIIGFYEGLEETQPLALPRLLDEIVLNDETGTYATAEAVLMELQSCKAPLPDYIRQRKPTRYLQYDKFHDYAGLATCLLAIMRNLDTKLRVMIENLEIAPDTKL